MPQFDQSFFYDNNETTYFDILCEPFEWSAPVNILRDWKEQLNLLRSRLRQLELSRETLSNQFDDFQNRSENQKIEPQRLLQQFLISIWNEKQYGEGANLQELIMNQKVPSFPNTESEFIYTAYSKYEHLTNEQNPLHQVQALLLESDKVSIQQGLQRNGHAFQERILQDRIRLDEPGIDENTATKISEGINLRTSWLKTIGAITVLIVEDCIEVPTFEKEVIDSFFTNNQNQTFEDQTKQILHQYASIALNFVSGPVGVYWLLQTAKLEPKLWKAIKSSQELRQYASILDAKEQQIHNIPIQNDRIANYLYQQQLARIFGTTMEAFTPFDRSTINIQYKKMKGSPNTFQLTKKKFLSWIGLSSSGPYSWLRMMGAGVTILLACASCLLISQANKLESKVRSLSTSPSRQESNQSPSKKKVFKRIQNLKKYKLRKP